MDEKKKVNSQRRQLLKGAALVASAGAAAAVGTQVVHASAEKKDENSLDQENHYHETKHIRDYYDSL